MTWNNFHGGIELRAPEFRWPGGKRIAVILRVALEGWSDGHAPGSGPMANPLKSGFLDLNSISWAEYGPRRGIHHILDILAKRKVQVSVLVCGIMAERYPTIVKKIAEAGHEIVAHSYTMDVIPPYLSESEERKNIAQTTDLLEQISGIRPNGWISPRATASTNTARLLAEAGYEWHGDENVPPVVEG